MWLTPIVVVAAVFSLSTFSKTPNCTIFNGELEVKYIFKIHCFITVKSHATCFFQAKSLAIEVYKWIRDVIRTQLQSIKPVQVSVTYYFIFYEVLNRLAQEGGREGERERQRERERVHK